MDHWAYWNHVQLDCGAYFPDRSRLKNSHAWRIKGYGKRALVSGQIGSQANRFNLIHTDPHFLDSNTLMEVRGYKTDTNYENNQGFNTDTTGGAFSVGHTIYERIYGLATYSIQDVLIKDVTENAPFLVKQQAEENEGYSMTSSITGSLLRDARDSGTEPTRGNRTRLSATYAGGFLGADNNFTKFAVESSQYWPLWWKTVFNLRGTFWYGDSYGDTPQLPVQERYRFSRRAEHAARLPELHRQPDGPGGRGRPDGREQGLVCQHGVDTAAV